MIDESTYFCVGDWNKREPEYKEKIETPTLDRSGSMQLDKFLAHLKGLKEKSAELLKKANEAIADGKDLFLITIFATTLDGYDDTKVFTLIQQ